MAVGEVPKGGAEPRLRIFGFATWERIGGEGNAVLGVG